ncbi:MAG: hypothetical protein AAFO07_24715 [Bacteroidota bacterium]
MNAKWKYYLDSTIFNLLFSILVALFFGFFWGIILFASFGLIIGTICFAYFKKKEYYFYYNLGHTKKELILNNFKINMLIAIPLLALYITIVNLL